MLDFIFLFFVSMDFLDGKKRAYCSCMSCGDSRLSYILCLQSRAWSVPTLYIFFLVCVAIDCISKKILIMLEDEN